MGEETSVRSPRKTLFRTSQSCEAVKNSSLRLEEVRELILRPQSIQLHISRIFHVSKQTSASC